MSTILFGAVGALAQTTPRVSITAKNTPVKQVLKEIERQTAYRFSYRDLSLDRCGDVTLDCKDVTAKEALDRIFANSRLTYEEVSPGAIVIIPRSDAKPAQQATTVKKSIQGAVIDNEGEPLVGATVRPVNNPTLAIATDIDGKFILKDVAAGDKITVSYIGYTPVSFKVDSKNSYDIKLAPADNSLDEVVVVGYGLQKKVNVTGAVSMIGDEVFSSRPVANVQQALQGAIPGLNLTQTDNGGQLNSTMSMNIRGIGTIGNGSVASPLVLIDGIEGNLNTLNPNDIESISLLKDAAAASIYGARAAFGVVLVTTKNGSTDRVSVSYSGDVRFSTATQLPDMTNSLE